jgi:hypothetical protein
MKHQVNESLTHKSNLETESNESIKQTLTKGRGWRREAGLETYLVIIDASTPWMQLHRADSSWWPASAVRVSRGPLMVIRVVEGAGTHRDLFGHVWLAASPRTRLVGANFTPIGCLHRDLGLSRRMQKSTLALAPGKRVSFPFPASQARCMRVGLQLMAVLARD